MALQATLDGIPDLTSCEQEPIRTPGAVQPHGVLLAMHPADLGIVEVSANFRDIFWQEGLAVGQSFEVWGGDEQRDILETILGADPANSNPLRFRHLGSDTCALGTVHRSGHLVVLELERESATLAHHSGLLQMRRAASRLEHVKTVDRRATSWNNVD